MIIYFADKNLNITGQASTSLPGGFRLFDDKLTEEIASGVNIFEFKVSYNDMTRLELESVINRSKYVLKQSGAAFNEKENIYNSLFQIVDDEFDTLSQEYYVYCEDAGLDLINKIVPEITFTNRTLLQMLQATVPSDWTINLIGTPTGTKTNTYEGENTATERINDIAGLFDCEVYYSFEIERFQVTAKIVNVIPKRGHQVAIPQLRLNKDINQIVTKRSRQELATAYTVKGGTPEGKDKPINLVGYSYSYTDPETGDVYQVDTATGQMRNTSAMKREASALDSDGLILKTFEFDTTDKAVLAGQARAELQKHCNPIVEYEVDIVTLPEGTVIGDRINIVDEDGELFLDARILQLETSISNMTQSAIVGDFLLKDSGISATVMDLAQKFAALGQLQSTTTLQITTTKGEALPNRETKVVMTIAIIHSLKIITDITELQNVFGSTARLIWYKNGVPTITGVSDGGFTMTVDSLTDDKVVYRCALEVV